jgi:hypothetical protein
VDRVVRSSRIVTFMALQEAVGQSALSASAMAELAHPDAVEANEVPVILEGDRGLLWIGGIGKRLMNQTVLGPNCLFLMREFARIFPSYEKAPGRKGSGRSGRGAGPVRFKSCIEHQ